MYDAILISTHNNYNYDGTPILPLNKEDYVDLSMIVPLGIVYIAQYLHDSGFNVRVVHIPHEMQYLRRFDIVEDQITHSIERILEFYGISGIHDSFINRRPAFIAF